MLRRSLPHTDFLWLNGIVNAKGNPPWIFIGRTNVDAEAPILWPLDAKSQLTGKDPDAGKDWRQEEKGATEDELVGWHHRLNEHEFVQTLGDGEGQGKPGVLQFMESQRVGHNLANSLEKSWELCLARNKPFSSLSLLNGLLSAFGKDEAASLGPKKKSVVQLIYLLVLCFHFYESKHVCAVLDMKWIFNKCGTRTILEHSMVRIRGLSKLLMPPNRAIAISLETNYKWWGKQRLNSQVWATWDGPTASMQKASCQRLKQEIRWQRESKAS